MSFTGNNRPATERESYLRAPRPLKASKGPARLPKPGEERPGALAVPFDYRLRLDDGQNRPPSGPQAGQPDPEDAFLLAQPWASYGPPEDQHLLSGHVLGGQGGSAGQEPPENSEYGSKNTRLFASMLGWSGRSYHKTDSRPDNASPYDSTKRGFR